MDKEFGGISRLSKADRQDILVASRVVANCMRQGLVSYEHVKYCASLGDEVCSIIFPNREEMDVEDVLRYIKTSPAKLVMTRSDGLADLPRSKQEAGEELVRFAVWCAEKALYVFENKVPNDDRPRLAIKAANTWLEDPSEENGAASYAASRASSDAGADASLAAKRAAAYYLDPASSWLSSSAYQDAMDAARAAGRTIRDAFGADYRAYQDATDAASAASYAADTVSKMRSQRGYAVHYREISYAAGSAIWRAALALGQAENELLIEYLMRGCY